jgi:hypothetical protein
MNKKAAWILFALLTLTVVLLEVLCARLAYQTLGEIVSAVYGLLVVLNFIPLLLFFRHRTAAALIALALALVIIPYQLILADRLWRAQAGHQRLQVVNATEGPVQVQLAQFNVQLQPGQAQLFDAPFASYLAPGVHWLRVTGGNGPEIWLMSN